MNLLPQNVSWQKVKGFLHWFNPIDHIFSIVVLVVLVPLRLYWPRAKDSGRRCLHSISGSVTDNVTDTDSITDSVTVSMIYDSIRVATGKVDAAYDYIRQLDRHLNKTSPVRCQVRLIPENESMNWKLKNALKHAREITKTGSRIIHIHYTVGAYKSGLAIYFVPFLIRFFNPRPKVIITYHQFTEHKPSSFLFRSLLLLLCLSVDGYIFLRDDHSRSFVWGETFLNKNFTFIPSPSNFELEEVRPDSRHPESTPQPAPHSTSTGTASHPVPRSASTGTVPHSAVTLSHFGTIRQGKGLETLIRAFSVVHEKHPDMKLILAGAIDAVYHQKLMRKISSYNVTDSMVFTGQLNPDELYNTLLGTIVVLPFPDGASTYRSSLMAALSMGLPIITTMSKHTPEIFEDGKNMFLARHDSYRDLAATIEKVISYGASDLKKVSREGYQLYSGSFSLQNCCNKHLAFYRRILS